MKRDRPVFIILKLQRKNQVVNVWSSKILDSQEKKNVSIMRGSMTTFMTGRISMFIFIRK